MKTKLLLLLLLANFTIYAQYTLIPDVNFENKLISLGIDSGVADGKVLTVNINSLVNLDISNSEIQDLTGIENFTSLAGLSCPLNNLTKLDLSKNTKLAILDCRGNKLTNLDFSKLPSLVSIFCSENFLTSLDVSKNPVLQGIFCSKNDLIYLNLKNGNNTKFKTLFYDFTDNPHLSCIEVDDPNYSNLNWADNKDDIAVYSSSCGRSYTNIPDVNFENKLMELGIDTDGKNGRVLTANIIALKSLDVSNSSITDLSGIENFMGLVTLNVSNNKLTTLSLNYSKDLNFLDCSNNLLTNLNVDKNTSLTTLNFSSNKLEEVDLWFNTSLLELNAGSNLLIGLNFTNINGIKTLDISNNQFNTLQLSNPLSLINLNCSKNSLTVLDLSLFTALNSLNCSGNQIINLDISKNPLLKEISCENNNLSYLNLQNGKNSLFTIYDFRNNKNLDCILVDDAAYSNTNWLNYKDSFANYNTVCNLYTLIPDINFEKKLIALGIDSGASDGKVLTDNINSIISLELSNSNIFDLTGIQKFTMLKNLNCSINQLSSLDISKNVYLNNLSCSSNKLSNLDITQNNLLITLNCASNQLTDLNLSKNINLTVLDCSINNLKNIDVFANNKLEKIKCFSNQLANLDVSKNIALITLDCSKNNISLLNLRNGANTLSNTSETNFTNNATLACILVDNPILFNTSWMSKKDALASYGAVCSRYTLIPDVNFEKKLILLGIDSGNTDGKILSESIENLTSLNVSGSNISNLTGIEDFVALRGLYCSQNNITVLDISKNTKLTEFSCAENKLTNIDISKNTYLNVFACWGNKLTTIDTSKNFSLNVFECYNNSLKTLDITKNTALGSILCYKNQLTSLDVSQNKDLWSIQCYSNNLTNIDISNNVKLWQLSLTSNKIKALDTSKNEALKELNLANNQIERLDVSKNLLLERLNIENNLLNTLDVLSNTKMTNFSCSNNQLLVLDVSKNIALEYFSCGNNQLKSLDISQNTKLKMLACNNNQIENLNISKNRLLTIIKSSNNKLTTLNIKNGNNVNFDFIYDGYIDFTNNPALTCIQVDNVTYSNTKWINKKDATASYSENCGYPLELPSNNFSVETKGESCLGENNGEINITAKEAYAYQANINNKTYSFTNNSLKVNSLNPGTYSVSVTIPNENFEQVFNITISKGATITGKSTTSSKKVNIEIIEGTAPFTVFVNGTEQFKTTDSNFSLDLNKGGLLEVATAKACEGIFSKKIETLDLFSTLASYPNPTSGIFEIEIPTDKTEIKIELYNIAGQLISQETYNIQNRKAQLNLENQASGIYTAKINLETPEYLKIIKK